MPARSLQGGGQQGGVLRHGQQVEGLPYVLGKEVLRLRPPAVVVEPQWRGPWALTVYRRPRLSQRHVSIVQGVNVVLDTVHAAGDMGEQGFRATAQAINGKHASATGGTWWYWASKSGTARSTAGNSRWHPLVVISVSNNNDEAIVVYGPLSVGVSSFSSSCVR